MTYASGAVAAALIAVDLLCFAFGLSLSKEGSPASILLEVSWIESYDLIVTG
jgi:hypothetical protein